MSFRNTLIFSVLASGLALGQSVSANPQLVFHEVQLDDQGKLNSWVQTQDSPYDYVVQTAWKAFKKFPRDPATGLKLYLAYPRYEPDRDDPNNPEKIKPIWWAHNPAGLNAMIVTSALDYYAYSGDSAVLDLAREALDQQLNHGTTPSDWSWASVPYASSMPGMTTYGGADDKIICDPDHHQEACGRGDGVGFIEPDKVGEFGYACLRFYESSRDSKYLNAALASANALVSHVRAGDETHSPWPFRVDAQTGTVIREEYTSNTIGPIMLFDELTRLGLGDIAAYTYSRQIAWDWLVAYPIANNKWQAYFEDIPIFSEPGTNMNQYSPLETARYLLDHPETDKLWRAHVESILKWVTATFTVDQFQDNCPWDKKGLQYGAEVLSEQWNDPAKMGSHTARFASVLARWAKMTGDSTARERALRSLNWATYVMNDGGLVKVGTSDGEGFWFSDGYGDYMRHFLYAMGAEPDWAPAFSDHLLKSTSVIRSIAYHQDSRGVEYTTSDTAGQETLRVALKPTAIFAGTHELQLRGSLRIEGYALQAMGGDEGYVLRVRHDKSNSIAIRY